MSGEAMVRPPWKRIARAARRLLGPRGQGAQAVPPDFSPEVIATVKAVQAFTMTSMERLCALVGAVEYLVRADIPGDIVECGVWRGGSMMAVALTLLRLERADRTLHLSIHLTAWFAASACNLARKAAFVLVRSQVLPRFVVGRSEMYLSNLVVFERPEVPVVAVSHD